MRPEKARGVLLWSTFCAWICVSAWIPYVFYAYGVETSTQKPTVAPVQAAQVAPLPKPSEPVVKAKPKKNNKNRIVHRPKGVSNQKLSDEDLAKLYENYKNDKMPREVFLSIVHHESLGNSGLVSNKNAIGLMGIMGTTTSGQNVWLRQLKKEGIVESEADLYDPAKNVRAGMYVWNTLYDLNHGDLTKTLKHYTGSSSLAKKYVNKAEQLKKENADERSEQRGGDLGKDAKDADDGRPAEQGGEVPEASR